jgi:hypothetical protein
MQLIRVSEQGKRCHERMARASARFPHAALAALAELLAQKEEKRWRIMLMTLLSAQPELAAQISPWLSSQAATLLAACQRQLSQRVDCAGADILPPLLVSPPWTAKKKITDPSAKLNAAGFRTGLYADGRGGQRASRPAELVRAAGGDEPTGE